MPHHQLTNKEEDIRFNNQWSSVIMEIGPTKKPFHVKIAENKNHWHLPQNEDLSLGNFQWRNFVI